MSQNVTKKVVECNKSKKIINIDVSLFLRFAVVVTTP